MIALESELLTDMNEKLVKNFLDMLILMKLNKGSMSAYDLITYIRRRFQISISPGLVYSHLDRLERDGEVKGRSIQRKRIYELTGRGEENVKAILDLEDKILGLVVDLFIGH